MSANRSRHVSPGSRRAPALGAGEIECDCLWLGHRRAESRWEERSGPLEPSPRPRHKSQSHYEREGSHIAWIKAHWLAIAAAAVLFFVGVAIGALGGSSKSTTETTTVAKTQIKTVVPAEEIVGNGTSLVGTEVVPGTYRAPPPRYWTICYWERRRNVPGAKAVIATGTTTTGPAIIKVAPTDYEVETSGCPTFHRIR